MILKWNLKEIAGVIGQLHTLAAVTLGKDPPWYPFSSRLGGQFVSGDREVESL
jgi:hypothetical protein